MNLMKLEISSMLEGEGRGFSDFFCWLGCGEGFMN